VKGYNSVELDGRDVWGKVCDWGTELPCLLLVHHYPSTSMCSTTQKLSEPCPFELFWRLHYIVMMD